MKLQSIKFTPPTLNNFQATLESVKLDLTNLLFLKVAYNLQILDRLTLGKLTGISDIAQFLINYHGRLATASSFGAWDKYPLYADTPSFRALPKRRRLLLETESERLNALFSANLATERGRVIISIFQARYWIASMDGIRTSLWLQRAIQLLGPAESRDSDMFPLFDELRASLLASLEMAPYSMHNDPLSNTPIYMAYDRISNKVALELEIDLNETLDEFRPRLDRLWTLTELAIVGNENENKQP